MNIYIDESIHEKFGFMLLALGNPKMLVYGEDCWYDPPIEAELGFELWAALRYSMLHAPDALGEEMPSMAMFPTRGYGFLTS